MLWCRVSASISNIKKRVLTVSPYTSSLNVGSSIITRYSINNFSFNWLKKRFSLYVCANFCWINWLHNLSCCLCLIVTKPPFLQFKACVVSYFWPQGHVAVNSFISFPYLNIIASLNFTLFKEKPYCSSGTTLIPDDEPGWLASSIAFFVSLSSFWLMISIFSFSKASLSFFF